MPLDDRARLFAFDELSRQAEAVAQLRSRGDAAIPDGSLWPALSRLAAAHFLIWHGLDEGMTESTLEAMTQQNNGLPPMAFHPEVYREHAVDMLERWRRSAI